MTSASYNHNSTTTSSTAYGPSCWGECQYTFKILLQGISGTGKSQIFNRIINDEFSREYRETYKTKYGVRFIQH
jgi:GTPase SAR1 family protein